MATNITKPPISKPPITTPTTTTKPSTPTTVKAGADGKAPKGLSVGSTVDTKGGSYKITGVNPDGTYKSEKIGTPAGAGLNAASGITTPGGGGGGATPPAGYLPVRDTGNNLGVSVGYNALTGDVSLAGNTLNKGDYVIINGKAYAKPEAIQGAVWDTMFSNPNGPMSGREAFGSDAEYQAYLDEQMAIGNQINQNWGKWDSTVSQYGGQGSQQPQQPQQPQAPPTESAMNPGANKWFDQGLRSASDMVGWAKQQSGDIQAMVFAGLESTLNMINQTEADLVARIQGQMGEDDPQLRAAVGLLRDEVQRQRDSMMEEMNARGLSQSGILLEMSDRMNKNELNQVQSLVASRIGDLQAQLNSALMNMANSRINTVTQFQGMGIQAAQSGAQNVMGTMNNLNNMYMQRGAAEQQQGNFNKEFNNQNYWNTVNQGNWKNMFDEEVSQNDWQRDWAGTTRNDDNYWKQVSANQADRGLNISATAARNSGGGLPSGGLTEYQRYQIEQDNTARGDILSSEYLSVSTDLENKLKSKQITYDAAMNTINNYERVRPPEYVQGLKDIAARYKTTPPAGGTNTGYVNPLVRPFVTPSPNLNAMANNMGPNTVLGSVMGTPQSMIYTPYKR